MGSLCIYTARTKVFPLGLPDSTLSPHSSRSFYSWITSVTLTRKVQHIGFPNNADAKKKYSCQSVYCALIIIWYNMYVSTNPLNSKRTFIWWFQLQTAGSPTRMGQLTRTERGWAPCSETPQEKSSSRPSLSGFQWQISVNIKLPATPPDIWWLHDYTMSSVDICPSWKAHISFVHVCSIRKRSSVSDPICEPWCWNIYIITNICPKNHPVL